MKRCLHCKKNYNSQLMACEFCQHTTGAINNIAIYAPEFLHQSEGFKAEYFMQLASLEEKNFWFRSRNTLILSSMKKYCSMFKNYMEIGCGTGFVLSGVAKAFPAANIYGSEIFIDGLEFAAHRIPSATCLQMDARQIPYFEEFDVIGAFDVLEHIEEDTAVLSQIYQAIKPEGMILITVPQHNWLWSISDDYACHVRRYSAQEIETKITAAGFDIIRSTSFVSLLLPAMFISRQINKKVTIDNYDPMAEFNLPSWLNALFEILLNTEVLLIRLGINFPMGGSRLVIAKRGKNDSL